MNTNTNTEEAQACVERLRDWVKLTRERAIASDLSAINDSHDSDLKMLLRSSAMDYHRLANEVASLLPDLPAEEQDTAQLSLIGEEESE